MSVRRASMPTAPQVQGKALQARASQVGEPQALGPRGATQRRRRRPTTASGPPR